MNNFPAPRGLPPPTGPESADQCATDDEIPLGWESAYPALQIERWVMEERELHAGSC